MPVTDVAQNDIAMPLIAIELRAQPQCGWSDARTVREGFEGQPLQNLESNVLGQLLSTAGACSFHSEEEWGRRENPGWRVPGPARSRAVIPVSAKEADMPVSTTNGMPSAGIGLIHSFGRLKRGKCYPGPEAEAHFIAHQFY
jgi:hypothetical protein